MIISEISVDTFKCANLAKHYILNSDTAALWMQLLKKKLHKTYQPSTASEDLQDTRWTPLTAEKRRSVEKGPVLAKNGKRKICELVVKQKTGLLV